MLQLVRLDCVETDERRVLLTHDDSYDENGEQVHADEKSVTKHVASNTIEIEWAAERTYRLFVKFFSHLAFKKRKTEQERHSAIEGGRRKSAR